MDGERSISPSKSAHSRQSYGQHFGSLKPTKSEEDGLTHVKSSLTIRGQSPKALYRSPSSSGVGSPSLSGEAALSSASTSNLDDLGSSLDHSDSRKSFQKAFSTVLPRLGSNAISTSPTPPRSKKGSVTSDKPTLLGARKVLRMVNYFDDLTLDETLRLSTKLSSWSLEELYNILQVDISEKQIPIPSLFEPELSEQELLEAQESPTGRKLSPDWERAYLEIIQTEGLNSCLLLLEEKTSKDREETRGEKKDEVRRTDWDFKRILINLFRGLCLGLRVDH